MDLSTKKQINTFVNINEKQTPVSKNLLWDLYPEIYSESDVKEYYKVKFQNFVKRLTSEKKLILYYKLRYPSAPHGSKSGPIDLNAICNSINKSQIYYNSGIISGTFSNWLSEKFEIADNKIDKKLINIFSDFFNTSKEISSDNWSDPKPEVNFIIRINIFNLL